MSESLRQPQTPIEVLLVEDNPGDVRLLEEAFKEGRFFGRLHVVNDGEQALAFLRRQHPYENSPRPHLVLLDLNLPLKKGHEILAEVKDEKELRQIPIFILSTSSGSEDISKAYDLHANCYIPKPIAFENLIRMGQHIQAFWLCTAVLPA
jgi:chemotaxis family two-component system response regulator Rcp1